MNEQIQEIKKSFSSGLSRVKSLEALQKIRVSLLGKKGKITLLLKKLTTLDGSKRKEVGKKINDLKSHIENKLLEKENILKEKESKKALSESTIDITLPGRPQNVGTIHPLTQTEKMIIDVFQSMGFSVAEGPEVETDYYNFEALNFPRDHPARDMQDTFFVEGDLLLRTHTSTVQIRTMEQKAPPIRIVSPGKVYRCDDIDATHSPIFHQVEGLCVGPDIHFQHFKGTVEAFIANIFGKDTKVRFRPSFFPFTEPSAEVDIMGPDGWLEIMGCGMVDPNVFENVGKKWKDRGEENPYDPDKISGFAFGMGVERIAMLLHQVNDMRLFYENDIRFLKQFGK
ncbi:MAG: phenylalanine--tRNA ligase subunit alpha [Bdellovibrionales bacterium]|nr:phenylalanine--tRNA ligase subunit alpha [Bdellovibrionales bacterium]